ncbi:uncharacterized protein LOC107879060 [Capsicum annuum]|uniref:uncharacterized protein LOC107879060 n=1 Tax=Capsicum annuum TaxID=4072 RepID=UPI0007BEFA30|nr:uncharacterized protein LOC107879060 [Capsicum annuum]
MAITLLSGKKLQGEPSTVIKVVDSDVVTQKVDEKVAKNSRKTEYLNETVAEPEKKKKLPLSFPQKYIKAKEDSLFKKLIDTFKELHIKLPLLDVLQSMPKNAKYLWDVVVNKVKFQDVGAISLTKECSIVITQTISKKLNDQGKFSIPIQIGSKEVYALSDLGESINLIVLSLFEKSGLRKTRSTTVVLQLVDDEHVPIILGRPFLAIGGALIEVRKGTLKIRVDDEEVEFDVYKVPIENPFYKDLYMINVFERDECEVSESLKTSSNYLIKWPKMKPSYFKR